jgi:uncharacterized protein (DUF433 family)
MPPTDEDFKAMIDRLATKALRSGEPFALHSDRDILGGTPVFTGTRVPLRNLIDYLGRGYSLGAFLDDFPSVPREQVVAVLEAAHDALAARAHLGR